MKTLLIGLLTIVGTAGASIHAASTPQASSASRASDAAQASDADLARVRGLTASRIPAASWAVNDVADSLWRRGRIAISEEEWREAANAFRRISDNHASSTYAGDALYWEAFALQRLGGSSNLRRATSALEKQRDRYAEAATFKSGESSALLTRINGRLARGGDPEAAALIAELATAAAEFGVEVAKGVVPMVRDEFVRAMPAIEAELRSAGLEMRSALSSLNGLATGVGRTAISEECREVVGEDRIEALNAMMHLSADQALPILSRVLERRDHCSEFMRRKAVFLIAQHEKSSGDVVDILVKTASDDPDSPTREAAIFWLSQSGSEKAIDAMINVVSDRSSGPRLQKQAVFALSHSKSPRAHAALRSLAGRGDISDDIRRDAFFWIGQQRDDESRRFLREQFNSVSSNSIREQILFSVAQSRSRENAEWLLERAKDSRIDVSLRRSALHWASEIGIDVNDLMGLYDSSTGDRQLREQVIFALSKQKNDPAAIDRMIDIVKKEQDRRLREQAMFWLGQSRDPRAVKALEDIINRPM